MKVAIMAWKATRNRLVIFWNNHFEVLLYKLLPQLRVKERPHLLLMVGIIAFRVMA